MVKRKKTFLFLKAKLFELLYYHFITFQFSTYLIMHQLTPNYTFHFRP